MKYNRIGCTQVEVTQLSFGCSGLGNLYRKMDEEAVNSVLECVWKHGIRYFDTAPHYGRGLSEERLGRFLQKHDRADYAISTKVGRLLAPGPQLAEADGFIEPSPNSVRYDYSGDGIEAAFEQSCQRLGTQRIDIVYVHDIGRLTHSDSHEKHMNDLMQTGLPRLKKLQDAGRIGAYGLGVNENEVCLEVMKEAEIDVILLAGRLTLLDRSAEEELVPLCQKRGVSLVLGGIFNSGILATGPVPGAYFDYAPASEEILQQTEALQRRAEEAGVSLAVAALQFALRHPLSASVLIGTQQTASLERNMSAAMAPWPEAANAVLV